jgi:hypothetical protein
MACRGTALLLLAVVGNGDVAPLDFIAIELKWLTCWLISWFIFGSLFYDAFSVARL